VGNVALAAGTAAFVFLLAWLLRRQVIAQFGRHITANRMALLAALEPPLRAAIEQYFAQFAPALDQRATELTANRQQQEPLLTRLRQIEQTFGRLEAEMQNPTRPATPPDDHGSA
jgi:flagellar biosynthesis/type III secretory pathway M-ring protein FliF/YscJ